ncbi:MAG: cyclic pyranopterin monophosphate synthase MoaC [Phycisphaerales bacterium]|nr:cyclic pyranopterin monophosphate synthase MoaC [Phycisphaerales bacterium]
MTDQPPNLSHTDASGRARMVDVGDKPMTNRVAIAEGRVRVNDALAQRIRENTLGKGDVLGIARLAGIQAAKRTGELIPLCHPLGLDHVEVDAELVGNVVQLRASARVLGRTGVEMEALTAVAVAALTVIDMGKAVDPGMVIEGVRVIEKRGGRSGHYVAPPTVER